MRWHADGDDLVISITLIKLMCSVAAVAVKNEQPIISYLTRLCVSVEVIYPLKAKLICCQPMSLSATAQSHGKSCYQAA